MLSSIDHYTFLLRAVARLDHTSYEARGAVYDRALGALIKRLRTAVPPYSEADIDRELRAFREAVRRIEFGDLDERERLAQRPAADRAVHAASHAASYAASHAASLGDLRQDLDQALHQGPRRSALHVARRPAPRAVPVERPYVPRPEFMDEEEELPPVKIRRGGLTGRVVRRVLLAAVVIAVGLAGYAYQTGQLEWSTIAGRLAQVGGSRAGSPTDTSEPARYYEQANSGARWRELTGQARWRTRVDGSGKKAVVLLLEVQVPERGLSLTMVVRRDESGDATLTHLIDLRFADAQGAAMSNVTAVSNPVMKQANGNGSKALAGRSIRVAPGMYLFGLSGEKEEARRNLEALRTLPRLDIPFSYANGATGVISVRKGASGDGAFAEAMASWAR